MVSPNVVPARTPSRNASQRSETILLVEDEEVVRRIVRLALTHRGYRVIEAPDAKAASRLWYENADSIDLLISDLGLGGESPSGLELAERFKGLNPDLKVLIITGRLAAELRAPFHCHFLQKPFALALLANTVRRALDEVSEQRAAV